MMDGEQARQELKQAETLLDTIQITVPTTLAKSRVWTAGNKLKDENSEEIPATIVPICASLDERAEFDRVKLPASTWIAPRATSAPARRSRPGRR